MTSVYAWLGFRHLVIGYYSLDTYSTQLKYRYTHFGTELGL